MYRYSHPAPTSITKPLHPGHFNGHGMQAPSGMGGSSRQRLLDGSGGGGGHSLDGGIGNMSNHNNHTHGRMPAGGMGMGGMGMGGMHRNATPPACLGPLDSPAFGMAPRSAGGGSMGALGTVGRAGGGGGGMRGGGGAGLALNSLLAAQGGPGAAGGVLRVGGAGGGGRGGLLGTALLGRGCALSELVFGVEWVGWWNDCVVADELINPHSSHLKPHPHTQPPPPCSVSKHHHGIRRESGLLIIPRTWLVMV
jgi:hypothetical protein